MKEENKLLDFPAASSDSIQVIGLTAFHDNYIWLLHNGKKAVVVDPGDAKPVQEALDRYSLSLSAILVTHHHPDHVGGLAQLLAAHPDIDIYGPENPTVSQINRSVNGGSEITILESLSLSVIDVPGHTLDHIAYVSQPSASEKRGDYEGWLFCGDTLFAGGCGRIFEGTPKQMFESLQRLASLAQSTRVFCAHEYTTSNLDFAVATEPSNQALSERRKKVGELRKANLPTVPSLLSEELQTNPFLRCHEPTLQRAALARNSQASSTVDVFAEIRQWKDNF